MSPRPWRNFHLRDIFGGFHRFFRPYSYCFRPLKVRCYPHAYCYSHNSEAVITKSQQAIISQSSYPCHEFALPCQASRARKLLLCLKQLRAWVRFYYLRCFRLQRVTGSLALVHQSSNYYHFLTESIAALEQIRRSGREPDFYLLDCSLPYQRQMWQLLGIEENKILPLRPARLLRAENLLVPTFIANFEIVEYRPGFTFAHTFALPPLLREFYRGFARELESKWGRESRRNPWRRIFLSRPSGSNRQLDNQAEVEGIFTSFGYEVILPDSLSLLEQARLARESKIIASMHGAGLSNVLFMREGGLVFEIFPQYYHDPSAMLCALLMGHSYHYMIARTRDIRMHPQREGAEVETGELIAALEKLADLEKAGTRI